MSLLRVWRHERAGPPRLEGTTLKGTMRTHRVWDQTVAGYLGATITSSLKKALLPLPQRRQAQHLGPRKYPELVNSGLRCLR